jgi:hypothetical protein
MRIPHLLTTLPVLVAVASCGGGGSGPTFGTDHARIYLSRNHDRLAALLESGAPAATRFKDMVDSQVAGGDVYGFESWYAALIGQLTGDASYCDYAVARTDAQVAAEEALIASGAAPEVAHDSYLEIGEEVGDIMLTYDWCFDAMSSSQKSRWLDFSAQAVSNVWHPETATWGGVVMPWSGWAIDDPSDNYFYSFLRATMMFGLAAHGEHPDADAALTQFRDVKIGEELVPTFDADLTGGGSREGTGYGVSMHRLWELYDFWQGSTGEDLAGLTPHTRASLLYYLHAVVPTRDFVAPYGDHSRDSTGALFDYERNYVQELSYLYRDDALVPEAKFFLDASSVPEMGQLFMYVYDFLYAVPDVAPAPMDSLGTAWYGPGIGELFARSSWDPDATWVSFIAGPYTQSHAHRDQGSLLLYKSGWLAYDPVIDSHSGIRQEEELHNLVRLDGLQQQVGTASTLLALHKGPGWLHVAADLAPVYGGAVDVDQRELVYLDPDCVVVFDRVTTDAGVDQIWQLNAPTRPTISGNRATIDGAAYDLQIDRVGGATATPTIYDWTSDPESDFSGGFRLDETVAGGARVMLHVLSIAGTVTAATASDADGRTGVAITFADGRTATVRFGSGGVGGTLELHGPSGDITAALDAGVDALPE